MRKWEMHMFLHSVVVEFELSIATVLWQETLTIIRCFPSLNPNLKVEAIDNADIQLNSLSSVIERGML